MQLHSVLLSTSFERERLQKLLRYNIHTKLEYLCLGLGLELQDSAAYIFGSADLDTINPHAHILT